MRRGTALAVPLILLTALVASVFAEIPNETGLPLGAQEQLESYIFYGYPSGGARVQSWARAGRPWTLTQDRSLALFGTSFQFSHGCGRSSTERCHPQQLPFPPDQIWCVVLEPEAGVASGPDVAQPYDLVFVALYMSLYEADWMVHRLREALPAEATVKALTAIGCDLGLDYVGPLRAGF